MFYIIFLCYKVNSTTNLHFCASLPSVGATTTVSFVAISLLPSLCCHLSVAISLLPSLCCHLSIAISLLPSLCCHLSVAISLLSSLCCHLSVAISLLPSLCCYLSVALSLSATVSSVSTLPSLCLRLFHRSARCHLSVCDCSIGQHVAISLSATVPSISTLPSLCLRLFHQSARRLPSFRRSAPRCLQLSYVINTKSSVVTMATGMPSSSTNTLVGNSPPTAVLQIGTPPTVVTLLDGRSPPTAVLAHHHRWSPC